MAALTPMTLRREGSTPTARQFACRSLVDRAAGYGIEGSVIERGNDLAACLDALWQDTLSGKRRFKLYRQMKMYNDPDLNPVLYKRGTRA